MKKIIDLLFIFNIIDFLNMQLTSIPLRKVIKSEIIIFIISLIIWFSINYIYTYIYS